MQFFLFKSQATRLIVKIHITLTLFLKKNSIFLYQEINLQDSRCERKQAFINNDTATEDMIKYTDVILQLV